MSFIYKIDVKGVTMKRLFLIFLLIFISPLLALEANEVLDKTIKRYKNMNSFYAEFEQTYCDEEAGICQRYEGRTYFMKPNFFRMEIDEPQQIYVGDSVSLWIYMPSEKRVVRQSLQQIPFQINPDALFEDYEANYDAEILSAEGDYYEISLEPKDETDIYRKMTVKIQNNTFEIIGISVVDDTGTESKFEFSEVEINKEISRDKFEFNPPEGVQVDEF
jgi:outer membrane lipoprotein carrier protein